MRQSALSLDLRAAAVLIALLFAPSARPQTDETSHSTAIVAGDSALSGFSGTVLSSPSLAPNVDPLDKTVIDRWRFAACLRFFHAWRRARRPDRQSACEIQRAGKGHRRDLFARFR